jgi:hypothetical protein
LPLYEFPFNEGTRTMLRLEQLFDRLAVLAAKRCTATGSNTKSGANTSPATTQNTGPVPRAEPRAPKIAGKNVWLALTISERMPKASPERPGGAL